VATTEKSSKVVVSPFTSPPAAISVRMRRMTPSRAHASRATAASGTIGM
jgi:hypothetical protein